MSLPRLEQESAQVFLKGQMVDVLDLGGSDPSYSSLLLQHKAEMWEKEWTALLREN